VLGRPRPLRDPVQVLVGQHPLRQGGEADAADPLLAEQIAYYRAIAPEYEDHAIPGPGEEELIAAIDAFQPTGDVLELACGPGAWTERLLRHATSVTAVDDDEAAVAALRRAAASTPGLKPIAAERRDLFKDPLQASELKRFDAVVFDPPRQGTQVQSRELAVSDVPVVVVVSCHSGTGSSWPLI